MKHNIIICGEVGSGKTYSLRSVVENTDKTLFVVSLEPGIENVLGHLPKDRLKWHYVPPAHVDWDILLKNAKLVNTMDMSSLQKMPGMNRSNYRQFVSLLMTLAEFTDDRNEGESFGMVDNWGEDKVLAIDGLSSLSTMALQLVVGAKPLITQPEWGAGMNTVLRFIEKLCSDLKCSFILNAHVEKQLDELHGGTITTISTLGNKLAPELIKPFDEIIYSERRDSDFVWSTIQRGVTLKTRTLGWGDEFKQDFSLILNKEKLL